MNNIYNLWIKKQDQNKWYSKLFYLYEDLEYSQTNIS